MKEVKQFPSLGEQVKKYERVGDEVYNNNVLKAVNYVFRETSKWIIVMHESGATAEECYEFIEGVFNRMDGYIAELEELLHDPDFSL